MVLNIYFPAVISVFIFTEMTGNVNTYVCRFSVCLVLIRLEVTRWSVNLVFM